ncbi:hypothetical protein LR48_Vigan07g224100 [Vigna angularis]|uniref:Uncharacterized protein n=1 Tax=Phaseolus angularis TaxID=3914 RepID=A0A0L9V115_PHAAN|nr:hypothetical protein LR48_Vigan07g224100 [Vigna angularis]
MKVGITYMAMKEWAVREIDLGDGLGVDFSTEAQRLLPAVLHELAAKYVVGEVKEVLNVSCGGELAAGGDVVCQPSFKEDRLELSGGDVHDGSMGGEIAFDDAEFGLMDLNVSHGGKSVPNAGEVPRLR